MATGKQLAQAGFQYIGTPYGTMDCQAFVEKCLSDCGVKKDLPGSNAWYRLIRSAGWAGTPEECKKTFGEIPVGAFLFILQSDGKEPDKYKADGLGNASHIGIYTGTGEGAIQSSSSRGCVCESKFAGKSISGGWNCVGLWKVIDYGSAVNQILRGSGEEKDVADVAYEAKVVGGKLNLRKSKTVSSASLAQIPEGTVLRITGEDGEWRRTEYNGLSGYVMGKYLEKTQGDAQIAVSRTALEEIYTQIGRMLSE